MMKKMHVILVAASAALLVCGFLVMQFSHPFAVPFTGSDVSDSSGGIVMTAQFPVYDKSCESITVVIENNSGESAEFGNAWHLEKNILGSWMSVPRDGEYVIESILHTIQPGGKYAFDCRLTWFIGDLEEGHYRIVKEINSEKFAAEFVIGESRITVGTPYGYEPAPSLGYDKVRADRDGACGIYEDGIVNEENLIEFLETSMIPGLGGQLRLYSRSEDGKMYFTDIVKLKHPVYRVTTWEQHAVDAVRLKMFSSSDINAFGKYGPMMEELIDVRYYNSLVTDGKSLWLSAYSDLRGTEPDIDDLCILPAEYVTDSVRDWIENDFTMQSEELICAKWNRDGSRKAHFKVDPDTDDEESRRRYFVSIYNDYGISTRGFTCGVGENVFKLYGKGGVRELVWADDTVVMMRAEDGNGKNYYEFYDTENEERLSYTITDGGYRIENGEIIIEE